MASRAEIFDHARRTIKNPSRAREVGLLSIRAMITVRNVNRQLAITGAGAGADNAAIELSAGLARSETRRARHRVYILYGTVEGGLAKIVIKVFQLSAPIMREHPLQAADRPADLSVRRVRAAKGAADESAAACP